MGKVYKPASLSSTLRAQRQQLRKVGSAATLARSGLSVTGQGETTVDGNLIVTGDFTAEGKISNDALVSPVAPGAIFDAVTGFALTTTLVNIETTTIVVPPGFTRAAVAIVARVYAFNSTASLDYLYGQANIAGYNGYALPIAVSASGGSGTNISPLSLVLDGLVAGNSFLVQIAAATGFAPWTANASNVAEVSGSIVWFR